MDRRNVLLFVAGGLLVVLGLAFFASPFASKAPDGLQRVAIDQKIGPSSSPSPHGAPLAGYGVKGVQDERVSRGLAGVIGVVVTFGLAMILFAFLRSSRMRREARAQGG
jgi:sulfite exporter TauE/SafE